MERELDHWLAALCEETITEEEMRVFEARLRADAGARAYYLRYMQMRALLEKFPPPAEDEEEIEAAVRAGGARGWRGAWWGYAAAACVAIGLTVAAQRAWVGSTGAGVGETAEYVGTLVFSEDCVWEMPDGALQEGQRLRKGRLHLGEGTAVVRFDGGAALVLTGETALELDSPGSGRLLFGEVVVRADEGAEGFVLATPESELVDLGTEFAVKVDSNGATELHVLEGEVALRGEQRGGEVIHAGKAVRLDKRAPVSKREVAMDADRFDDVVRRAKPRERRDLMWVYEGFQHEPAVYAAGDLDGGKGWAGPWRLRTEEEYGEGRADTSTDMRIVESKLNVTWPVKGGLLGMMEFGPGKNYRVRPLANRFDMGKHGIRYFSFMVREPAHRKFTPGDAREGMRLTFRSSEDYFGEALSFGWTHRMEPRIRTGDGRTFSSTAEYAPGQTIFCVGKVISRPHAEDEISFRMYAEGEELDFVEPQSWDVQARGLKQSAAYDLVLLSSEGEHARIFDEIRIGPSWRSVVPIKASGSEVE